MGRDGALKGWPVTGWRHDRLETREDVVIVEEPLEIQVALPREGTVEIFPVAVTMRTPGHDEDLALGFLYTEALIPEPAVIARGLSLERPSPNEVRVILPMDVWIDRERLTRHFYMTSSCGICGKAAIEAIFAHGYPPLPEEEPVIPIGLLYDLPRRLREAQALFRRTGGLHAAAIFDAEGRLLWLREDVGRHNAVDKAIGAALREGRLPLSRSLLLVSGRAGFEIAQKALRAGIPILAALGAPSSLTLELAQAAGMTVVGFLREGGANIYTAPWRIRQSPSSEPTV
ncbi:Sulfurtransferase FdhD [Candidatus Thermoflexus japonica]|uniref:Sulfur carrier protein FdhD n=1 Tax=Candidatus Thermoflexus japonica TaxID=2035417 RepID=A0A2H5Y7N1_9CHLR|nr:Sulfurtransferase FdhD [Candidatus Thermoflexus japonica]